MARFVPLLVLSWLSLTAAGGSVNVTWDDGGLDPVSGATWTYMPADQWDFGPTCTACSAKLDATLLHNKTWHDATYQDSLQHVQIDFVGTAFYLYGVLSDFNDTISSIANYSYFMDGDLVGTFTRSPSGQPIFLYDFLLYANSSMPNGSHQFSVQNGKPGDSRPSLVLLDYAIYSTDASLAASANATISTGPLETRRTHIQYIIIASVISFAVFMVALVGITYHRRRRHRFHSRGQYDPVHPVAFPDYWEDLPKTPSSAKGSNEKFGTRPAFRQHGSSLSDAEATDHLLRPVGSVVSTSSRSTSQTDMTPPVSAKTWQ
ncbi:hypothetical protein PHLGIDRAFT_337342 [Phlebiopsis gigantea 11061_1 CR5-6]|uniref:Uncharacterized protein n=1 Tax=Phlebiopsis gigantea (strain 11061_1 CR5-6) TaxID=745531 RepID=A0A0C3RQ03_PHLG1|nr:hypothetical protein PHLGIDRAFT_337342 [Phlebiopsis gigantea 11061_1 CR5-6]